MIFIVLSFPTQSTPEVKVNQMQIDMNRNAIWTIGDGGV